jgi:hypothetical protein
VTPCSTPSQSPTGATSTALGSAHATMRVSQATRVGCVGPTALYLSLPRAALLMQRRLDLDPAQRLAHGVILLPGQAKHGFASSTGIQSRPAVPAATGRALLHSCTYFYHKTYISSAPACPRTAIVMSWQQGSSGRR